MFGKKIDKNLSEKEVIDLLINWTSKSGKADLRHFTEALLHPTEIDKSGLYTSYLIKENVLRTELGFDKGLKPGDFDVIIIPCQQEKILIDRTAVFEVKVVRPTRRKPTKNSNSLGVTQVKGLVDDGFPFVGLIHVCMTEPLLEEEKTPVQVTKAPLDMDNPKANIGLFDDTYWDIIDRFGSFSSDKQMQRLIRLDIPKYIGINAISLEFYEDGSVIKSTCSQEYWNYQKGYFNPHKNKGTIEKLKKYIEKEFDSFKIRI